MVKQLFTVPNAQSIARKQLEDAKSDLLHMQATAEHSAKMVEYYLGLVERLTNYTKEHSHAA